MKRGADGLIVPHGGALVDLMVTDPKQTAALYAECQGRTIELSDRNACDVELLTVGCAAGRATGAVCAAAADAGQCALLRRSAFSPLSGFMDEESYTHCVDNMRLKARAAVMAALWHSGGARALTLHALSGCAGQRGAVRSAHCA